ncbi:ribonuclease H-like domain-containing protein [Tanacetum coccineum]
MAVDDDVNSGARPSSDLNLSFGDPLYLHLDDTSRSPIVTIKLTGTKNYKMWSIAMTFALRNHNKLGFIDGTCKRESDNPSRANQWDMCNSVFLMGLDESYLAIRSNLLTREPLPSVKTAFSVISSEESHRNISSIVTTKPTATAFLAKTVDNNKKRFNNNNIHKGSGNSNSNNKGPNPNLKCTNCNKIGHIVDRCFEIIRYPAGYVKKNFNSYSRLVSSNNALVDPQSNGVSSNNATTSNSFVSLSSEQLARLMNLLNENGVSTANANMADFVIGNISVGWIVDSGGNDDSEATLMDEINNTHPEGTVFDETDFINEFYENSKFNIEIEELPVNTLRRSSRQTKLPSSLNDFVVEGKVKYGVEKVVNYAYLNLDNYCFISALNKSIEPNCYEEAILDSIDFNETFSPVVKMSIVRCVIASSVTNCWPLFQLDFNNAFLYGDLDEDIYMTIPKGFASKDNKNKVCKLVKSLYGLKQAPRKWNEKLVSTLKENDFVQSMNDHSFFTKSKNNKFIALLVYVDDIVIT